MPQRKAILFDAFGTLFQVQIDVQLLNVKTKDRGQELLDLWRTKQLEYTWLFQIMNAYQDFGSISRLALMNTMNQLDIRDPDLVELLLNIYYSPIVFSDVLAGLEKLQSIGIQTYILSNGTQQMLSKGVSNAKIQRLLNGVLSVDSLKQYKPAPAVYEYALAHVGVPHSQILFVSSNPWDVAGAAGAGLDAIWLNRKGIPYEDLGMNIYAQINSIQDLQHYL